MANCKKLILLACASLMHVFLMAQSTGSEGPANNSGFMRSEAKIYVVMAVVITILAGLILYVVRLDRKISKLERGDNL